MLDATMLAEVLRAQGLWLMAPLAVIEGPVVTVLAGWLVAAGVLNPWAAFGVAVFGDLAGDVLFYALGRRGLGILSRPWRRRLGLSAGRVAAMTRHFRDHGARTLIMAKLSHAAGAPVLVAAGAARMPILPFLGANLFAALPKVAGLMALGWGFGASLAHVESWLARLTLAGLVLGLLGFGIVWEINRRRRLADAQ